MIHVTQFIVCKRSGFISRVWLAIAISLFSFAASAESYPVSGVGRKGRPFSRVDERGVFYSQKDRYRCCLISAVSTSYDLFRQQAV